MKNLNLNILILSLSFIIACQNSQPKQIEKEQPVEQQDSIIISANDVLATTDGIREPTDDEIREYGIIKSVEDGIYPMFIVTIEFPERQMESSFDVNMGNINFEGSLYELQGKYISFYYIINEDIDLYDMEYDGKSIMGESAFRTDGLKTFTGVISGADVVTSSDLPGLISLKDSLENKLDIRYYVPEEMVMVNGKEVTVYYKEKWNELITYIEVSLE